MDDEYNVNGYTDEQLFQILDLNNPSDRELEAKILKMVRKYEMFGNQSGDKLSQFFIDIYNRFFENGEDEQDNTEGFTGTIGQGFKQISVNGVLDTNNLNPTPDPNNKYDSGVIGPTLGSNIKTENIFSKPDLSQPGNGVIATASVGNKVEPAKDNVKLTRNLDYSKDKLNPLLKQTIKRIISIDSQYRNQNVNSPSTNFTFNLSEPIKDVVSLSLYSVQIPYTWYTVNSDFGGNLIYLKGNTPGITNGLHDYKIEIPSGNYTPSGLAAALNNYIQTKLIPENMDVSFGTTAAVYNNGIPDQNSGTGKCALNIDITKIYNESNYYLQFPHWTSPIDPNIRINTIAGYLGFNEQTYYCSAILSTLFKTVITTQPFPIVANKFQFDIVPYIGNSYLTADSSFTPITIKLNISTRKNISITEITDVLNSALKSKTELDKTFTNAELINITDQLKYGNTYSYVKMSCKLNDHYSPIVSNLKLAAVFPYDPSDGLFYGTTSLFAFSDNIRDTRAGDTSGNVICEFNELLTESPILQSTFDTSGTKISFKCSYSGFDNSYNNFDVTIPTGTYTLDSFLSATNNAFDSANASYPDLDMNMSLTYDTSSSYLNFNTSIYNTFVNKDYYIYATIGSANLPNIFNLPSINNSTNIIPSFYNNGSYNFTSVAFDASDVIYIIPKTPRTTRSFTIPFLNSSTAAAYSNGSELANYMNNIFSYYLDTVTGTYPFSGSNITYSVNSGFTLNVSILLTIDQSFYNMRLLSNNSVWSDLKFDSSSNPNVSYNIQNYSSTKYVIPSNEPIKTNKIKLYDNSNNDFVLSLSDKVNIFSTSNNKYSINIKIPDTSTNGGGTEYAINDLLNQINSQLDTNPISKGTIFSKVILTDGRTLIKIRFNINTIFTTKDYSLVFYDPYSFATCFKNNSKSGVTSLQNATWDTTLGWLLGYRESISYDLSGFLGINAVSGTTSPSKYYLTSSPNVCVLLGDTNVSTNLYNYFLIMLDDYVQNHLNDGLVTITNQETTINHGPYVNVCDPSSGLNVARPADYGNPGISYTSQQLYAFNQQVQSQIVKTKSYSSGPFVKDVFGIIPIKTSGMAIGSVYVEFGGSMQNQQRLYFGPVNIHRMTIKLLNDRGNLVDLNNANWSFSFICEQLYKNGEK